MSKSFFSRQRVTAPLAPVATPFSSTSTAAVQIHYRGRGKFVVSFLPTQNCYIKFGTAGVAAADSSSWPLTANKRARFIIDNSSTHFRVIRKSADGVLDWFVEGAQAFPSSGDILGSLLVDEWISDVTASASTWTSVNSRALTGTNTPTWGLDGTNFGSRKVIGSAISGNKYFTSGALTGLPASGTLPYVFGVYRASADSLGVQLLAAFGTAATNADVQVYIASSTLTAAFGGTGISLGAVDTAVHMVEIWSTGAAVSAALDGTVSSSVAVETLGHNMVKVSVGNKTLTFDAPSDSFHGRWGICSSVPSDEQRAALLANMKAYYAF